MSRLGSARLESAHANCTLQTAQTADCRQRRRRAPLSAGSSRALIRPTAQTCSELAGEFAQVCGPSRLESAKVFKFALALGNSERANLSRPRSREQEVARKLANCRQQFETRESDFANFELAQSRICQRQTTSAASTAIATATTAATATLPTTTRAFRRAPHASNKCRIWPAPARRAAERRTEATWRRPSKAAEANNDTAPVNYLAATFHSPLTSAAQQRATNEPAR